MGFTVKRVLRRVLRRGSAKGVFERPLGEDDPLGVRPSLVCRSHSRAKKNFSKNFSPNFTRLGTAKLANFQGKTSYQGSSEPIFGQGIRRSTFQ